MDSTTYKICTGCKRELPLEMYNNHSRGRYGKQAKCKDCKREDNKEIRLRDPKKAYAFSRASHKKNIDKTRAYARNWCRKNTRKIVLKRYGLTPEDYYKKLAAQGGKCAICSKPPKDNQHLHVDHDHATNTVRGLLCGTCNRGIGMFKDDRYLLSKAIEYLS